MVGFSRLELLQILHCNFPNSFISATIWWELSILVMFKMLKLRKEVIYIAVTITGCWEKLKRTDLFDLGPENTFDDCRQYCLTLGWHADNTNSCLTVLSIDPYVHLYFAIGKQNFSNTWDEANAVCGSSRFHILTFVIFKIVVYWSHILEAVLHRSHHLW